MNMELKKLEIENMLEIFKNEEDLNEFLSIEQLYALFYAIRKTLKENVAELEEDSGDYSRNALYRGMLHTSNRLYELCQELNEISKTFK